MIYYMTEAQHPNTHQSWLSQVVVRPMVQRDLPALEWEGEYIHFRRLYAAAFERMRRGNAVLWVADLPPDQIIGQVFIALVSDRPELADGRERAYLYSFRIKPQWRGAGLGTRMLSQVESDLRRRGYKAVTLNVALVNTDAQRLYLRCGYRMLAPDPGIWSYQDHLGVWQRVEEPAVRMIKYLGP